MTLYATHGLVMVDICAKDVEIRIQILYLTFACDYDLEIQTWFKYWYVTLDLVMVDTFAEWKEDKIKVTRTHSYVQSIFFLI